MRFPASIAACLVAAYALSVWLTVPANPELEFWHSVDQLRDREIADARQRQPNQPMIFFTGGSSCAFSIDPGIIEEEVGRPAFNLGLPVSAGPKYILHQALEKCRAGDMLVVCLEPDLLTYPEAFAATSLSFAMASANSDPSHAAGGSTFQEHPGLRDYLNLSRPGPGYIATWLAKAATGKGYRYQAEDIRYRGRIETPIIDANPLLAAEKGVTEACPTGIDLLTAFKSAAVKKGVVPVYSMPWVLTASEAAAANRDANRKILDSLSRIIPVVDDEFRGVATDSSFFSDSPQHLTAKGASIRSRSLGLALKNSQLLR